MNQRPYVLLSVAASLDGYIDDASDTRLLLSTDDDFDRVDEVRAWADAVLVGAGTVRADDPRLLVRSAQRQRQRRAEGRSATPIKVTVSGSGDLDPAARFFSTGDIGKLVYTATGVLDRVRARLGSVAEVVDAGDPVDVCAILEDLADRKVERVMVEGGGTMHTQFLAAGVVDELHLVYVPFFVGDPAAPRFVNPARFPQDARHRMTLAEARPIGDVVFLRYLPRRADG